MSTLYRRTEKISQYCGGLMLEKTLRVCLLSLLLTTLAACGFHLRGSAPVPPELKTVYVDSANPYGRFEKALVQALTSSQVKIAANSSEAPVTIRILSTTHDKETDSIGANSQTRQYTLTYTVTYELRDSKGNVIIPARSIIENSNYITDSSEILGDTNEENSLQDEMRREALSLLMIQLNSKSTVTALKQANQTAKHS